MCMYADVEAGPSQAVRGKSSKKKGLLSSCVCGYACMCAREKQIHLVLYTCTCVQMWKLVPLKQVKLLMGENPTR